MLRNFRDIQTYREVEQMNIIVTTVQYSVLILGLFFLLCIAILSKTKCSKESVDILSGCERFLVSVLLVALFTSHMMYLGGY